VNTGVALFLLLAGFMLDTVTMPDDASAWLALLSTPGHEQPHSGDSKPEGAEHHAYTSGSYEQHGARPGHSRPCL